MWFHRLFLQRVQDHKFEWNLILKAQCKLLNTVLLFSIDSYELLLKKTHYLIDSQKRNNSNT